MYIRALLFSSLFFLTACSQQEQNIVYDTCTLEDPFCSETRNQCHVFGDQVNCFSSVADACAYAGCPESCTFPEMLPSEISCS